MEKKIVYSHQEKAFGRGEMQSFTHVPVLYVWIQISVNII